MKEKIVDSMLEIYNLLLYKKNEKHMTLAKSGKELKKFLKTVKITEKKEEDGNIGILVCPWLQTPVPWYGVVLGLLLKKKGKHITLIVNDMWISCKHPIPYGNYIEQNKIIVTMVKQNPIIKKYLNVVYLSEFKKVKLASADDEKLYTLAQISAVRQFGSSGNADTDEYKNAVANWRMIFREFYPNILSVFSEYQWEKVIIPGGLFLESGLFFEAAKNANTTVITYDSSYASVFLGINTQAARNGNVKEAVEVLKKQNKGHKLYIEALKILDSRRNGEKDIAPHMNSDIVQRYSYEKNRNETIYDVIIFMNVETDTAALGTHKIFKNDLEWLTETIDYLLKETNYKIAVREHPMQRLFGENELSKRIEKLAENDRVHFIKYDASINSYNLIEISKTVVVCTSTIGLEAAIYGKPVVLESNCYYGDSNCIKSSRTKEQYFKNILEAVNLSHSLTEEQKEEAGMYYCLTQRYGSIRSDFSAQPIGFAEWIKETFDDLSVREDVNIQIDCILDEEPLCLKLFNKDKENRDKLADNS